MKKFCIALLMLAVISFTAAAQSGVKAGEGWMYGYKSSKLNFTYDYTVRMLDNSVKVFRSKIYADTDKRKSYLIMVDKDLDRNDPKREQKIYVDQTVSITRIQQDMRGDYPVMGAATDSCWLFGVVKGKINAYSNVPEVLITSDEQLRVFQVDDGAMAPVSYAALAPVIKADRAADKQLQKKRLYRAIAKFNDNYLRRAIDKAQ
ncbi:hypothetical protein [Mucilaginibacter myungsuensis]|uniref:GLPGLI family protein n=1 Tax=Mucilaginibacter myungsuensis TaxID=649104 RepID=A0A929PXS0_9SPHI|nr:hypothetical protein [Mucilaginibacter myungsuensis]MBE9663456.1 hypothetical protein [Mucilaginibacter myungsuensis]MDN3600194.1 hypothetical protein [Mucilaginibacter myungsuensis]